MGAFIWDEDQSEARFVELGQDDLLGTPHDAPASEQCGACHSGEPGRILGFSALQLGQSREDAELAEGQPDADAAAWTLARLESEQRLSSPPPEGASYSPPGDATTAQALGYLHANCGHCHNPRGTSWPDTQMVLRLAVESPSVEETDLYGSIVNQALQYYRGEGGEPPHHPRRSPGECSHRPHASPRPQGTDAPVRDRAGRPSRRRPDQPMDHEPFAVKAARPHGS